MSWLLRGLLFCLCLSLCGAEPRVLVLSLDGLGSHQVSRRSMPQLTALARTGLTGESIPPAPSTTFNGHATLATGCAPVHHGIVGNSFVEPQVGFISHAAHARHLEREPLWIAATRAGLKAAVYHWPCGDAPWRDQKAWRQEAFQPGTSEAQAMAFCEKALAGGARLVMAYFSGTDETGHRFGPRSPENLARLRSLDRLLTPWLKQMCLRHDGLKIILTADHGMAAVPRRIELQTLLKEYRGRWIVHGRSATLYLETPTQAAAVLSHLRSEGLQAWPSGETLPHPRAGHVLVQAPPGSWLSAGRTPEEVAAESLGRAGAHGSLQDEKELRAYLLILGAGKGKLGAVSMKDIAPTAAAWLEIPWVTDGTPLPSALPR